MDDTTHVLVGYATANGSTAGVAERIAARLRGSGCEVDCRPVGADLEPARFDAIVLGSAVHDMAWLRPAIDFLHRTPGTTPTWFFSVGGVEPRGPVTRRLTALEIARVEQGFPPAFRGRVHRLFAGVVHMAGLALWGGLLAAHRRPGRRPQGLAGHRRLGGGPGGGRQGTAQSGRAAADMTRVATRTSA